MSILIEGMEMPMSEDRKRLTIQICSDGSVYVVKSCAISAEEYVSKCTAKEVPPHGRLIDADALRAKMYHEAFGNDTPMQKWDSGCWIRYKMFERMEEAAPTIIEAEE